MGIRHKIHLGYGLDLSKIKNVDKGALDYERLEDEDAFEAFRQDVITFAKDDEKNSLEHMAIEGHLDFQPTCLADMTCYDAEFGIADKLLLTPAGSVKWWSRYDDDLDCALYEAQHERDSSDYLDA